MTNLCEVPGVAELVGRGVYTSVPDHIPIVQGQHAVVVAKPDVAAAVVLRLSGCGCDVIVVTRETAHGARVPDAFRHRSNIRMRYRTELSWAVGIEHLEAVVLRHITTGRIEACNAAALFVLSSTVL